MPKRAVIIALALISTACGEQGPDADLAAPDLQSAYVDLYLEDGIEICAGQLDSYDRFIENAFAAWTGDAPGDFRATVRATLESQCWNELSCARQGTAWLYGQLGQYHELAHLVHAATEGWSAAGLNEGVAEALGPTVPYVIEGSTIFKDDIFGEREALSYAVYVQAAAFVRFLRERHGQDSFRGFFRALGGPDHPAPEAFAREFEVAFAESLADAWPVLASETWCPEAPWYCEQGIAIDVPFSLEHLDCSSPATLGFDAPAGERYGVGAYWPFTVLIVTNETPRTLRFEGDAYVDFVSCTTCSASHRPGGGSLEGTELLPLEAGRTAIIVRQRTSEAFHVSISAVEE